MSQSPCPHRLYSELTRLCLDCGAKIVEPIPAQPDLEKMKAEADAGNETLAALADNRNFLYHQFRTQLRNLMLSYLHALTQSKYKLEFYENGSIKSISPKGWSG